MGEGWLIGKPDLVLRTKLHKVPAEGFVKYRYEPLSYVFPQDTWIDRIQILPDNPKVVHHCNLILIPAVGDKVKNALFVTGKVPGGIPMELKDGIAVRVPRMYLALLQIHFTTDGHDEKCRIAVGFRYAREKVQKELHLERISNHNFAIAAGDPHYKITESWKTKRDIVGVGLFSHMHVRGTDMTYLAHYPDGKTETLLVVPNYSFDWQIGYSWPVRRRQVPGGNSIRSRRPLRQLAVQSLQPRSEKDGSRRGPDDRRDDVRFPLLHGRQRASEPRHRSQDGLRNSLHEAEQPVGKRPNSPSRVLRGDNTPEKAPLMKRFQGKVAIITGGGSGIGRATCLPLRRRGGGGGHRRDRRGARQYGRGRNRPRGGQGPVVRTDVADEQSVRSAVARVAQWLGRIDILVNNAAVFVLKGIDASVEEWRKILDVNVMGPALVSKHVVPEMEKTGGGAIVNLGSISSFIAQPQFVTYNTTKTAVLGMTRCMALIWPRRIFASMPSVRAPCGPRS